jgi:hypothetical protein
MDYSVPIELTNAKVRNISFQVLADVYKNNTFSCDITSYIISIDNIVSDLEFRQKGSVLGKPSINTASISLDNTLGKFSPNNSNNIESQYPTGQFRTNTPIKIIAGFLDATGTPRTRVLFHGVITSFKNKITQQSKQVVLQLKDHAIYLQKMKIPNHDYKNNQFYEAVLFDATINEAIDYLIDYSLGTSFPRTLHHMNERLPMVDLIVGNTIWQTLQLLAQSVEGRIFFEAGEFKFYSPLSPDWNNPLESQYTFNADNIQDFEEEVDWDNIINKWKITSNPKTMQLRQVLVGTPSSNTVAMTDEYWTGDTKSALGADNKTITLKSQDQYTLEWIDSLNVPLVYTQTYSDLIQSIPSPTQDQINTMNNSSLIKVWDRINNIQLTINSINVKTGTIELLNTIDPDNYNIQITYQYYQDQIVHGKYREYIYDLEKIGTNIELPVIIANNIEESITYSTTTSTNTLYLSDWTICEGNKRVKFKLTNNVPIAGESNELDTVYITKFEVWGNALECTSPLSFTAIDGDTISQFENSYEINNDYISNIIWGKQIVDLYLYKYKSNLTFLDVNTKGIPQIDLLDRVTIQEAVSGNNFDYIVIGIKHSIKKDGWKTNLQLESLIPPWTYDESRVNALYYKYGQSYLSLYSDATPQNPNAFSLTEQTFVQTSGEVVTRVYVTFMPPLYAYYSHTLIQMSGDNGLTWSDCGTSNDGKFYIYNVEVGHHYKIRAVTVSLNGQKSNAIEGTITISGKDTPPSDITGFNIVQSGSTLRVSVVHPGDPDIRNFELRFGPTWANSALLKTFVENQTTVDITQEGVQTFWVKAVDNSGNYSTNAKKAIITITGLPVKNVINERDEDINTWEIVNMYLDPLSPTCYLIDTVETFDTGEVFADIFEGGHTLINGTPGSVSVTFTPIDLGPNVIEENYFYYDAYGAVRLKTTKTLADFTSFFDIFGYAHQYVVPQYKIITFANIDLNYVKNENNYVNIWFRTSINSTDWGEWMPLTNHQFFGRYIQFKLYPGSLDRQTNVRLCGATVQIDVPTLEEDIENISIPASKTWITFNQKFFDVPKSIALFTCDSNGKQVTWRSNPAEWTKDGFYIELLDDAGSLIAGKLILAKVRGY